MLLPLACLKRYFLKVLQRLSEFVQHYQSLKSSPSWHWQNRVFRPSIQQSLARRIRYNYSSQNNSVHCFVIFFRLLILQTYLNTVVFCQGIVFLCCEQLSAVSQVYIVVVLKSLKTFFFVSVSFCKYGPVRLGHSMS